MLSLLWCRLLIVSSILLCDVADEGSAPPASADAKVAAEPSPATQPPTKTEQPPRPAPDQRQPPQRSAYVDKMLQQDRNKDGRLSKEELPASQHHLWKHDLNDDGLLGPRELAAIEAGTAEHGGRPDAGERPVDGRSGPAGLRGSPSWCRRPRLERRTTRAAEFRARLCRWCGGRTADSAICPDV